MAARRFTEFKERKLTKTPTYKQNGSGGSITMREKPAFPGAGVPGKTQGKNRSLGVYKCHVYPKSEGL